MTLLKCHEDLKHHHQNEKTVLQELEVSSREMKSLGMPVICMRVYILASEESCVQIAIGVYFLFRLVYFRFEVEIMLIDDVTIEWSRCNLYIYPGSPKANKELVFSIIDAKDSVLLMGKV